LKATEDPETRVKLLRSAAVSYEKMDEEMNSYCAILGDPEDIEEALYETMRFSKFEIVDNREVKTKYGVTVWRYGVTLIRSTSEITSLISRVATKSELLSLVFEEGDGNYVVAGPDSVLKSVMSRARSRMKIKVNRRRRGPAFIETSMILFDVMPRPIRNIISVFLGVEEETFSIMVLQVEDPEEFRKIANDRGVYVHEIPGTEEEG